MVGSALIVIVVLAIVGILAGYWFLTNYNPILIGDPKALLISYGEMFNNTKNIKLTYEFKFPALGSLILQGFQIQMDLYKLNDDTKVVFNIAGQTSAIYTKNGKMITCTESSLFLQNSVQCNIQTNPLATFALMPNQSFLDQTVITYKGTKSIAGRNCDDFDISINESQVGMIEDQIPSLLSGFATAINLAEQSSENKTYIIFEMCMDKVYGYPALMNYSMSQYSTLSGQSTTTNLFSLEVTNMSTDVKESDMKLPVDFTVADSECTQNSLKFNITAFNDISSPRLDVTLSTLSKNITTSKSMTTLQSFNTYTVSIPLTQAISSGFYDVYVCIGSECQSDYCLVTSTQTLPPSSCDKAQVCCLSSKTDYTYWTDDCASMPYETYGTVSQVSTSRCSGVTSCDERCTTGTSVSGGLGYACGKISGNYCCCYNSFSSCY